MNLREFVAVLDCQKPEASEFLVMAMDEEKLPLSIKSFRIDKEAETVWLNVEDY